MARKKKTETKRPTRLPQQSRRQVESYEHRDKERLNNRRVGLLRPEVERTEPLRSAAEPAHLATIRAR